MSDRDWDAEMRKIDQQLASMPKAGASPARARGQGAPVSARRAGRNVDLRRDGAARTRVRARRRDRFWPYAARCGFGWRDISPRWRRWSSREYGRLSGRGSIAPQGAYCFTAARDVGIGARGHGRAAASRICEDLGKSSCELDLSSEIG